MEKSIIVRYTDLKITFFTFFPIFGEFTNNWV